MLGFTFVREQRANEMIARHERLINTIANNTATPPPKTFYKTVGSGSMSVRYRRLHSLDEVDSEAIVGVESLHGFGSPARIEGQTFILNISRMLPMNRDEASRRLLVHYEQGLEKLGLEQRESFTVTGVDGAKSRLVLASDKNELTVVIDTAVAATAPTAEVRILVIDAQQLPLW